MIDFRILTFLNVCETRNFTKTAKNLCITQPAVTQHIKYLEGYYNTKLIDYEGKKMIITKGGEILLKYARESKNILYETEKDLQKLRDNLNIINIGATLTIGEFIMPDIVKNYIKENPKVKLNLIVDNTQNLIEKLKSGKIDFAFIEGYFNKEEFEYHLYKEDEFVLIASKDNNILNKENIELEDIKKQKLIIREKGSGSREILERLLANRNITLDNFKDVMEIGNINIIKELIKENLGITFIYKVAVKEEIEMGNIKIVGKETLSLKREFNFVFSKNTLHKEEYIKFLQFAKLF